MTTPLNLLIVEDTLADAELMLERLRGAGFEPRARVVKTEADYLAALESPPELILCDHRLPQFNGLRALDLLKERKLDIPFILVSGAIGEELTVDAIQRGVDDYLFKDRLARLGPAVTRALELKRVRDAHQHGQYERARLAAIVESSHDAIISRSLDRKVLTWNPAAECLFGWSAAEAIGQDIWIIVPHERRGENAANRERLHRGMEIPTFDTVRMAKDGRRIDVSLTQSAIRDEQGNIVAVSLIFRDISERRRMDAERAQLAAIVENSNDAIIGRSLDGTITSWNASAERLLGYSASEAVGRPIAFSLPPGQHVHTAELNERLLRGEAIAPHETRRQTKDGRVIDVMSSISPLRDSGGQIVGASQILHDITARKQAEEAQARLAAIVESSNDAIVSRTFDGTITTWNAGAERMFGYAADEAIGRPITLLMPPGQRSRLERNTETVRSGEVVAPFESQRMTKGGRVLDVLVSVSPLRNAGGRITGASAIFQDISALKQAEAELRDSEERFRAAFEQAAVGMALRGIDPRNSRWLRVNQKLCDILGYSREELRQLTSVDVTPPEDRNEAIDYNEKLIRGEITSYSREKRYLRKDGSTIWANISLTAVRGPDGRPIHVISVIEDVTERKRAESERAQLAAIVENSNDAIIGRSLDGTITSWNAGAERLLGYSASEAVGRPIAFSLPPGQHVHTAELNERLLRGEAIAPHETRRQTKDGRVIDVMSSISPLRDSGGQVVGASQILHDITALKQAEAERARLATIVESANDAIIGRDLDGTITSWNPGAQRIFGYTAAEAIGQPIQVLFAADDGAVNGRVSANNERIRRGESIPPYESQVCTRDGRRVDSSVGLSPVRDAAGKVVGAAVILRDITERKQAQEQIAYLSQYDALTGLPNRNLFRDRLELAIARAKRQREMVGIMLFNLDRFKQVNEGLGLEAGDELLRQVAARLKDTLRELDTIARLGSDEFAILVEGVPASADVTAVAEKLIRAFAVPFEVKGNEIVAVPSIGITIHPNGTDDSQVLLEHAEIAMERVKREGGGGYRLYDNEPTTNRGQRLDLETRLRYALARGELELHYQPKVRLMDWAVTGAEALLRWNNPELGPVSPARFIPIAEESGLIVPIGEWVLRTACAQMRSWHEQGHAIDIAVNLSPRQFRQKDLAGAVVEALKQSGLAPGHLELEITEGTAMSNAEQAVKVLGELHGLGVRLSVDDFGTGYSSLAYLKRFPLDSLKIDRSFVMDVGADANSDAIVCATIALAQSLKLKVVAEGVETEAQRDFLARAGCDEMQGYLYSRPLPAAGFSTLIKRERKVAAR